MEELMNHESKAIDSSEAKPADLPAPVVPDELVNGEWHRRLVLPDRDGHLRLTPVRTARGGPAGSLSQLRFLDDKRRHSA